MKVFQLGGKAFPFGESGAQAPREVTIFHKSTMKVSPLGGKAFPFGESGAQVPREEKLSPSGRVARKRRERKSFPLRGEWRASAERGHHFFYKSTMKVSPLGGIWNSMEKPSHSAKGSRLNESVPTRRNIS